VRKLLLASVAVAALTAPAFSADLYTKAPPAPLPPALTWTGFYIGGFGGYGWTNSIASGLAIIGVRDFDLKGGFGGGLIGYNWQTGNIVLGLEADVAGADISRSVAFPGAFVVKSGINTFGTVRGRLGFTATPAALLYVTGGYAWARNKFNLDIGGFSLSETQTHSGWTIGGGVEYMFLRNWSAKIEYLYADFGSKTYFNNFITDGLATGRAQLNTIKGGINYHF
jgi:outer membrane immunogenic protein